MIRSIGSTIRTIIHLTVAAVLASACGTGDAEERQSIAGAAGGRRPAAPGLAAYTGLSHLPEPADHDAFAASLRRHHPAALLRAGRGGDVLVDVRLDESGRVLGVDVVEERTGSAEDARVVVLDPVPGSRTPVEREVSLNYDPAAFGEAAKAAVRESRFRPALRDGKPVPYTLRMTVSFSPHSLGV